MTDASRAALPGLPARSSDPHNALARDPPQAARLRPAPRGPDLAAHGAVALPIRIGKRVIGCKEGVDRCLGPLRGTQALIEGQLTAQRAG